MKKLSILRVMKKIQLLVLLFIIGNNVLSQTFELQIDKEFQITTNCKDLAYSFVSTGDEPLVLFRNNILDKAGNILLDLDKYGKINNVIRTSDNCYVISRNNEGIDNFIKINSSGDVIWKFNGEKDGNNQVFISEKSGFYTIIVHKKKLEIRKFDDENKEQWVHESKGLMNKDERIIDMSDLSSNLLIRTNQGLSILDNNCNLLKRIEVYEKLLFTSDGGILTSELDYHYSHAYNDRYDPKSYNFKIMKYDNSGNFKWYESLKVNLDPRAIIETSNNDFYVVGDKSYFKYNKLGEKISENGTRNLVSSKYWIIDGKNDKNGSYIIARSKKSNEGTYSYYAPYEFKIIKLKSPTISGYIKNYVANEIEKWEKKGEFEKTIDYNNRVNEITRNNKIDHYTYLATKQLKRDYIDQINWNHLSLGTYDADNEVYHIESDELGSFDIPVDISSAKSFKSDWSYIKPDNIDFSISDQCFKPVKIDFVNVVNGKIYRCENFIK